MQVQYTVRVRAVAEEDLDALAIPAGDRAWVRVCELEAMALTGLARKVLLRSNLPELAPTPANA